jgi:hypothetical protein
VSERKEMTMKDKYWSGIRKEHAGGEGAEALDGEVFSMRQESVARHGKKSRRWLRIVSDGRFSRKSYAFIIEQKY